MRKKSGLTTGFTLVEIVIVIVLTSIIMVTIFQALGRARMNETKFEKRREVEKEVYLLYIRLSNLFKNASSFKVFNNREQSVYFLGSVSEVIFLSRAPLISPFGGIHFVDLCFREGKILYSEKMFREPEEGDFLSFEELDRERFYTLMAAVDNLRFQYYLWDEGVGDFVRKEVANSFEKDPLPVKVSLDFIYEGKDYHFNFHKVIMDENKEIPPHLLK